LKELAEKDRLLQLKDDQYALLERNMAQLHKFVNEQSLRIKGMEADHAAELLASRVILRDLCSTFTLWQFDRHRLQPVVLSNTVPETDDVRDWFVLISCHSPPGKAKAVG
jgi:hypothetical protein